jgi:hypothetical protein
MLIDEYSDFEKIILENMNAEANASSSSLNSSLYLCKNLIQQNLKNNSNSIELSDNVKIYFEPALAKKFV